LLEMAATVAFALSGVMDAARKRLDAVGVCVVGFLAAFGGGTLRDLLLDQRPFFWVRHVDMAVGRAAACVWLAMLLHAPAGTSSSPKKPSSGRTRWGLGLFAAAGVDRGAGRPASPAIVAVLMGVITGVFGGVLRDVVCNEIPTAFSDHRPYAVCAFAGGWAYVGLAGTAPGARLGGPAGLCLAGSPPACAALAFWRNWQLPAWHT
jgi:uncharacterized membrane protein YeiH